MQRFDVRQEQEDIWSVSSQGRTLYLYSSEEEARSAALMMASNTCESGTQASITISPPKVSGSTGSSRRRPRFTGM
jgi:predicted sugar kinase